MFAGNFAPRNWSYCNGNLLAIASNTALFSLLGTTYGGDGRTTFGLPDFRSRTAVGTGTGAGLSQCDLGEMSGTEGVTLLSTQMPSHTHTANGNVNPGCSTSGGDETNPSGGYLGGLSGQNIYSNTHDVAMGLVTTPIQVGVTGSNQPHDNIQPSLGMNYIICLYGIFPSRN